VLMHHLTRASEAVSQILAGSEIDLVRGIMHLDLMYNLTVVTSLR
jgi:hypothetical protein